MSSKHFVSYHSIQNAIAAGRMSSIFKQRGKIFPVGGDFNRNLRYRSWTKMQTDRQFSCRDDESRRAISSAIESSPRMIHSLSGSPLFRAALATRNIMYPGRDCSPFYVTADLIWLNARVLWTLLQLAAAGTLH